MERQEIEKILKIAWQADVPPGTIVSLCRHALALERDNEALKYSLKAAEEVGVALGLDLSNLSVHLEKLEAVREGYLWVEELRDWTEEAPENDLNGDAIKELVMTVYTAAKGFEQALAALEKGEKDAKL